jgi:hypothetical protein
MRGSDACKALCRLQRATASHGVNGDCTDPARTLSAVDAARAARCPPLFSEDSLPHSPRKQGASPCRIRSEIPTTQFRPPPSTPLSQGPPSEALWVLEAGQSGSRWLDRMNRRMALCSLVSAVSGTTTFCWNGTACYYYYPHHKDNSVAPPTDCFSPHEES